MGNSKGIAVYNVILTFAIIAVILLLVIIFLKPGQKLGQERDAQRKNDMYLFSKLLEKYRGFRGSYPTENFCDSSIGSQNTNCPVYPAKSGWDKNSPFYRGLMDTGLTVYIPTDPINSMEYYYVYEPDSPGEGPCDYSAKGPCRYWVGARLESPKDPSKPIYRCTDSERYKDQGLGCQEVSDWWQ